MWQKLLGTRRVHCFPLSFMPFALCIQAVPPRQGEQMGLRHRYRRSPSSPLTIHSCRNHKVYAACDT